MTVEASIQRQVNTGVTLLISVILLRISFYHLNQLNAHDCPKKCNVSLSTYTTLLYVEAVALLIGSLLFVMSIMYAKQNPKKIQVILGSPAMWGVLAANLVGLAYATTVNGIQTTTLHELRKCDCVKNTNADLTTFVYFERIVKLSAGVLSAGIMLILALYMVQLRMKIKKL